MKKHLILPVLLFASMSHTFFKEGLGVSIVAYGAAYGINWLATRNAPAKADLKSFLGNGSSKETTLFVHGIAETHDQALWYTTQQKPAAHLIDGKLYTYDFPDATKHFWRVNFTKTALGQDHEVQGLQSAWEQLAKNDPENNIILMGMSRGAATILNFVAKYQPVNVKAIVVESPFDTSAAIVKNMLQKYSLDKVPGAVTLGHYLMSAIFWQHSPNGMQPIDGIEKIDKNIPILFICSREDKLIPAQSVINLYQTLKSAGHQKVHIFIAESGKHGRILHNEDGANYEKVTNAFYKKYGMAYNQNLAAEGELLLDNLCPENIG